MKTLKRKNEINFMADIIVTCQICKSKFYFTQGEQKFYKSKGLNIPKKCKNCRTKPKPLAKTYIPRACSTCYFLGCVKESYYYPNCRWTAKFQGYGYIESANLRICNRSGKFIFNDAPCSNWTRRQ